MQLGLVQKQIGETIVGGAIPTLSQKEVANYLNNLSKLPRTNTYRHSII